MLIRMMWLAIVLALPMAVGAAAIRGTSTRAGYHGGQIAGAKLEADFLTGSTTCLRGRGWCLTTGSSIWNR